MKVQNQKSEIKNQKYKAVIFDLGDVYYNNGFKKALAKLVLKNIISKKYLREVFSKPYIKKAEVDKITEKEFWKEFKEDTGIKTNNSILRKEVFKLFVPKKGMSELVKECRKRVKVGLLTNNLRNWFKIQQKKENFSRKFDAVLVSAKVGLRKPQKKIYFLMTKKLKVKPEECIFFDDTMENVKGARKVGMKGFLFKNIRDCKKILKKLKIIE